MFWENLEKKDVGWTVEVGEGKAEAGWILVLWFHVPLGRKSHFQLSHASWARAVQRDSSGQQNEQKRGAPVPWLAMKPLWDPLCSLPVLW